MLKRTIATVFVTALLCLGLLPVTALAGSTAPQTLYGAVQHQCRILDIL